MKNIRIQIKILIFVALIIFVSTFNISAQEQSKQNFYNSDLYKISFQIPIDSAKQSDSNDARIVYVGEENKFGVGSKLEFIANDSEAAGQISQILSSDEGMETIVSALIKKLKVQYTESELTVLEKKRVQIAGLNGLKIMTSNVTPTKKFNLTMFVIPVPDQKRMYSFIITAFDGNYDKWYSVAEASVNSFELLKSEKN